MPFFYQAGGAARVHLVLEAAAPGFDLAEVSGKLQSTLDVLGIAYDAGGNVAARFVDREKFSFDNRRQFDDFARQPLRYEHQFGMAPGSYRFKLIFRTARDRFGVVEMPLVVDPFDAGELRMSAIALSRDVRSISPEAAQAAAAAGQEPLVFHGNRIAPAGADVLSKTGIGEAYFEIYPPPAADAEDAAPSRFSLRVLVFDEPGNRQQWDSGGIELSGPAPSGGGPIPVAIALPLAALQPGAFRAKITVTDSNGDEASQSVHFHLE
jgi:hypothetical protein